MIPSPCGIDVSAFIQKSGCSSENSTFPKLVVSGNKITIFEDDATFKTFKYDNICNENFQGNVLESLAKSVSKDVAESISRIIFRCKLSENVDDGIDMKTISSFMLNSMYAAVNSKNNCDISLHLSCIEVNNMEINDIMQKCNDASNDLKVFEFGNQNESNLTERIITNSEDMDKIIESVFQNVTPHSSLDCRHQIVFSTIIAKTRNNDGFEVLRTGHFILVDIGGCINFLKEVAIYINSRRESLCLVSDSSTVKETQYRNCNLNNILKNFLSISKISVMIILTSTSLDLEHIQALEIVSELQNLRLKPIFNERLILRESLKDYADEIKLLEKDLEILKNNNGISMSQQKYRSLKNRLLLSETQLKDSREEKNTISASVSNRKEILKRLELEINLTASKTEEEMQKLKLLNVTLEETKQKKASLNLKKMEKVDACVSMNNLIYTNEIYVKNQNSYLKKIKHDYEKSSSTARILNEDINNYTIKANIEQNKLKDKVESLLLHLKEILLNSTIQQNTFILHINEFYQKFEQMLKFWKQNSSSTIAHFHNFVEGIFNNCFSLRNKLCSELASLNITEGAIIEVIKKNEVEALQILTSCSTKIHMSAESSIKLLYEVLCFLEISQVKVNEKFKKLESAICCHSNERLKFLNSTNSTMASLLHYFNVQLHLSSQINSDIFSHHQKLKQNANQEFVNIKEALDSLKKLFSVQQKFVVDRWQQRQTYLSNVKEIGGVSEPLQQCTEDHPILLDKLRQQCVSSIDELYSIFSDQKLTVDNLGSQLKNMFNQIECGIENCSEESKKRIHQQNDDIQQNLEIQNKTVIKCINITRSLVEGFIECINGGLQNTRNSFFDVEDLKKNIDANPVLELRNIINGYIKKYSDVLELSELAFQQLPETVSKQTENLEDSIEFNHEELLSSTPSHHERHRKIHINEKNKFLNRLKKMAAIQVNTECQDLTLDQESMINSTILSLPNMSTRTKVEIRAHRSLAYRKGGK